MTSIKIVLSEEQKKRIKKASIDANKTLSRYVLDIIDPPSEDLEDIHDIQAKMIEWIAMENNI